MSEYTMPITLTGIFSYLFDTDSYKPSHWLQYPPDTTGMTSYIESRGGAYKATLTVGAQLYVKRYLLHRVTVEEVELAREIFAEHGEPFNYEGWMYIATELKGKLPVRIRAVPEGTIVPTSNILVSIESTDPKVFWIVSWIETLLLRVWYPITVATRSFKIKQIIYSALLESCDNPDQEILYKLHNFGARGASSQESAMISDIAHTVSFRGTDTVVGLLGARLYYNCRMSANSIPAAEHSSITSWGPQHEVDAYRNMLKHFAKPGSMVAIVSDSYDLWNACENLWGGVLRQEVIDSGAVVIIRPDSGDPVSVVLRAIQILDSKFGGTVNLKGFRVLNNVRVIQGDGINEQSIKKILDNLINHGYSAENVAFGMGGGLTQQLDRDTNKFAMKCSHIYRGPISVDVFKNPVTDPGKASKAGRLDLIKINGQFQTIKLGDELCHPDSVMQTIYENGDLLIDESLDVIRTRPHSEVML